MRILISNDDGIEASGLEALVATARRLTDDVWVVAPDGNRSGVGHGVTLHRPLIIARLGDRRYRCSGTPADCVIAAQTWLFAGERAPDLVLSGINEGINVAEDIAYSGTMAIAREAVFWGMPAVSVSRPKGVGAYDDAQLSWLAEMLRYFWMTRADWADDGRWLNFNLPARIPATLREARIGRDKIAKRTEVLGVDGAYTYLQMSSGRDGAGSDGDENHLIGAGYACVTNLAWHGHRLLPQGFCEDVRSLTPRGLAPGS
ncbi:MAG: 5'/3'-nucleotidase SurE [Pseudomonadota bacterium]